MKNTKRLIFSFVAAIMLASCTQQNEKPEKPETDVQEQDEVQENQTEKDDKVQSDEHKDEHVHTPLFTTDKDEIEALANEALEIMAVVPDYPKGYPTLEDVKAHYDKAVMAIGWIVGTEKIATDDEDLYEYDDFYFQRIRPDCHYGASVLEGWDEASMGETQKLIYNKQTLQAYLATLLTSVDAENYMIDINGYDVPRIKKKYSNGALYALPYTYSPLGYSRDSEDEYFLTSNGDGTYTFTVNYDIIKEDGERIPRSEAFIYMKENGRWVFDRFRLIKQ